MPQPNILADLALILWPFVAWACAAGLGPARGTVVSLVAGYLLLPPAPAGLDLPLLPPLTKDSVPSLAALLALVLTGAPKLRLLPEHPLARACLAGVLLVPWATVLANSDPVAWGRFVLPALRLREAVGILMGQAIVLLPFLIGRALLADDDGQRRLLAALLWGGLAYSLPMLLEVRLSPQLNTWVYGYFQHDFTQMMRGGGYRPIVFLYHGLWAAFLAMTAFVAALALGREGLAEGRPRQAILFGLAALWMLATLILCKSLASLLYGVALAPLLLLPPRRQLMLAAILSLTPLAYPVARATGLVPVDRIVAMASHAGEERAFSLQYRLDTEETLLARAQERPLFGWGLWGRNMIYERDSGRQVSIPDGRWIILLGVFGWSGLVAAVGLLVLPPVLAAIRSPQAPPAATGALALILAVNLIDLVPNATDTPLTWLMAGALLGWAERQAKAARERPAPAFRTVL